nr:MAG TPA: hypothetical protein [Caudoviricetes sp.]
MLLLFSKKIMLNVINLVNQICYLFIRLIILSYNALLNAILFLRKSMKKGCFFVEKFFHNVL